MNFPLEFNTDHYKFVNYAKLTDEESKAIWNARNNPAIAKWMTNSGSISLESHLSWVKRLSTLNDRVYYAVMWGDKIIGSQSLNPIINDCGESGLYILPCYQGRGHGKLIKKEFANYILAHNLLQQLTVKVKKDNIRNIHLNLSLGFEKTAEDSEYVYFRINHLIE